MNKSILKVNLVLIITTFLITGLITVELNATSLWEDSPRVHTPYGDDIAVTEGDLVKIAITEDAMAQSGSSRDRAKNIGIGGSSGEDEDDATFVNNMVSWLPFFGAEFSGGSEYDSRRAADVSRTLNAEMSVEVVSVSDNGTLDLEGSREVKIEDEITTLNFTGQARQQDVEPDNTIPSNRIANAQMSYEGELGLQSGEPEGLLGRSWTFVKNVLFW